MELTLIAAIVQFVHGLDPITKAIILAVVGCICIFAITGWMLIQMLKILVRVRFSIGPAKKSGASPCEESSSPAPQDSDSGS